MCSHEGVNGNSDRVSGVSEHSATGAQLDATRQRGSGGRDDGQSSQARWRSACACVSVCQGAATVVRTHEAVRACALGAGQCSAQAEPNPVTAARR